MKLPLVLIVENNQFAYSTPISKQFAGQKYSDRALGYGIHGVTVDGTNIIKVYETCKEAVDRARRGDGPTLIETITMRMHGHSASDDASYVPKEMLEEWKKKDPLEKFERILVNDRVLNETNKKQMEEKIAAEIEGAIQFAFASPYPTGPEAAEGVYSP
jgi:TPP-dependent pyruvate/acetoin dehydrogenase alpha subunit